MEVHHIYCFLRVDFVHLDQSTISNKSTLMISSSEDPIFLHSNFNCYYFCLLDNLGKMGFILFDLTVKF